MTVIKNRRYTKREDAHRVNRGIRAREVRLVEADGSIICSLEEALSMAKARDLDLVEISPNATPPVCKIINHAKFKYEQKKKQKLIRSSAQKVVVKTIGFSPNTGDNDIAFKTKHAIKFLKDKAKVNLYVHFSGREIKFKEIGLALLKKVVAQLAPYGRPVEEQPKMERRRMMLMIAPLKNK